MLLYYSINYEVDEKGYYTAICNNFEGCYSQGETLDEARKNIKEAIQLCLDDKTLKTIKKDDWSLQINHLFLLFLIYSSKGYRISLFFNSKLVKCWPDPYQVNKCFLKNIKTLLY